MNLLEKLEICQQEKKFPSCFGAGRFTTEAMRTILRKGQFNGTAGPWLRPLSRRDASQHTSTRFVLILLSHIFYPIKQKNIST
jgi:hypothetical protein